MDKTFGFSYLVEGIQEAYSKIGESDDYVKIHVDVQKSDGIPVSVILILVVAIVSAIAFFIYKTYKK